MSLQEKIQTSVASSMTPLDAQWWRSAPVQEQETVAQPTLMPRLDF
jgi:hypothetical protein